LVFQTRQPIGRLIFVGYRREVAIHQLQKIRCSL